MTNTVRFKRSDIPGKVPSLDDIQTGEIAINTYDGRLFTNQTQGALSKIIEIGATAVDNVLYVSVSGDDDNDGTTLGKSKRTLKAALAIAKPGTTIYLKSGEYIEDNPILVPARVAIVGDSLRTTTIRPANPTLDVCWVNNGSYITQLNFKGHLSPSAAVAFPPDGSAGFIVTSPYVQSCTSITTTGTGMRVDGNHATGLRSMVVDAFTQYNQGGIGIHMLNGGNTQLVSVFTICCDISFLCEDGGFCSITNSNSSFGNYGLKSIGTSPVLYSGVSDGENDDNQITLKNLTQRPNIGDSVIFANYNQETCERDAGFIVDSLAFDLLYQGSTQSTFAGLRYWAKSSTTIPGEVTQTLAAITRAKNVAKDVIQNITVTPSSGNTTPQVTDLVNPGSIYGSRVVGDEFDLILNILGNGPQSNQVIVGPDTTDGLPELQVLRSQIIGSKNLLENDTISYLTSNYPSLEYDRATCRRDIGLILEAISLDLVFGTNYQTVTAGLSYLRSSGGSVLPTAQLTPTVAALTYLKTRVAGIVIENPDAFTFVETCFDTIIDIISNGESAAPAVTYPPVIGVDSNLTDAVTIIQDNKSFITAEAVQYIANEFPTVVFNSAKCQRDIGYVLDAISYNLAYGGNSAYINAAEQYYSYATGSLTIDPNDKAAAIAAYIYVQLTLERVIVNDPVTPLQNVIVQDTSNPASGIEQVTWITRAFSQILSILENGIVGDSDTIVPNGIASTNTNIVNSYNLLQANKNFIIDEVIAYLAVTYPTFTYNQATCERDLGYIIDSVSFDLLHGGNRQAVQSGVYYYGHSSEINYVANQLNQTLGSYVFIKDLVESVITATPRTVLWQTEVVQDTSLPAATSSETAEINSRIDLIIDILNDGPSSNNPLNIKEAISLTASSDTNVVNAFNLLIANKDFIKKETIAYVNSNWASISGDAGLFYSVVDSTPLTLGTIATVYPTVTNEDAGLQAAQTAIVAAKPAIKTSTINYLTENFFDNFTFDKAKCYRDVGLIVDAVTSDMVFGTNYRTIMAGLSYLRSYSSNVLTNQKVATLAALKKARDFTVQKVANPTAITSITDNFNLIIDIIDQGLAGLRQLKTFDKTYVSNELLNLSVNNTSGELAGFLTEIVNGFKRGDVNNSGEVSPLNSIKTNDALAVLRYQNQPPATQNSPTVEAWIANNIEIPLLDLYVSQDFGISFPNPSNVDSGITNAAAIIQANDSFIRAEISAWLAAEYPGFTYNIETCERDVSYILDAITYDLLYGGNSQTISAAKAYFNGAVETVIPGEVTETVAAYNYLGNILQSIVQNTLITKSAGNIETQDTSLPAGSLAAATTVNNLITVIENIVAVSPNEAPATIIPTFANGNTTLAAVKANVDDLTPVIQAETLNYIETSLLAFNKETCARDVGLLIDAVGYDIVFNSNYQSVKAGLVYNQNAASVVRDFQLGATVAAINFIKNECLTIVSSNATASTRVTEKFNIIADILENGVSVAPAISNPNPTGVSTDVVNAVARIESNRSFIIAETMEYLAENYANISFNAATCQRDMGYIIDAVKYDLLYGGNSQIKNVTAQYFSGGYLQIPAGDKLATIAAYSYMSLVTGKVITDSFYTPLQGAVLRNTSGTAATSTEVTRVDSIYDAALDILESGYSCTITLEDKFNEDVSNNVVASFHQSSQISASGHTFEWIGSGTDINSALPYKGGVPVEENEVIQLNGGKVFFTSTDQKGNFKIGTELIIQRSSGSIAGRAFSKSLLGVMTPYILALEG